MPIHQQIIWTALPTGTDSRYLYLSVFVAPRLLTDGPPSTLASFDDFAAWPDTDVRFAVRFGTALKLDAEIVNDDPAGVDRLELYRLLFPDTTTVGHRSFQDLSANMVASYPALAIADWIQSTYTLLALANPPAFPSRGQARQLFDDVAFSFPNLSDKDVDALENEIALGPDRRFVPPLPASDPNFVAKNFLQLRRFHRPRGQKVLPAVEKPTPEYHEVLGMLGEYPDVLRIFRFIFDLRIPLPRAALPLNSTVQVVPRFTSRLAATVNKLPRTKYKLVPGSWFRAEARDPLERPDGLLGLDRPGYGLIQIDHGGSGQKAMQFADNLVLTQANSSATTTPDVAAPSLRAGGISIARVDQAGKFLAAMTQAKTLNDKTPDDATTEVAEILFAEDITRGVAIDVYNSASRQWHPLMARLVSLRFQPAGLDRPLAFGDEHWVSTAPTKAADGTDPDLLYLQETFVHWSGFSLAAPRPGLTALSKHPPGAPLGSADHEPLDKYQLRSDITTPPGTLPRLRFGSTYHLRARTVDLAGNRRSPSTLPADPTVPSFAENHPAGPLEYWRFEPVQTPPLLYRTPPTEGETLERMVIRTNVVDDLNDDTPALFPYGPADGVSVLSERHIVAPGITQRMCEEHGLFDDPLPPQTVSGSAATYALIAERDGMVFAQVPDPSDVPGLPAGASAPIADPEARIPYFPDVLARGVALLGLPGTGSPPRQRPFDDDNWPGYNGQRIVLRPGPGAYDEQPREFTVFLTPGERVNVRYSAFVNKSDLDVLGIWKWILGSSPSQTVKKALTKAAATGQHWMLTPSRQLTLVHAVRKPLVPVTFQELRVLRNLGQTFARIVDFAQFSRISTGKVELVAEWEDKVDDGPGPPETTPDPFDKPVTAVASIVGFNRSDAPPDPFQLVLDERHEFHDTKHRRVSYSTVATTAYKEHFVEHQSFDVGATTFTATLDTKGVVPGSVELRVDGSLVDATAYAVDPVPGTISVAGLDPPAHLDVSYLVPPITQASRPPQKEVLSVPSSARPAVPKVLYALPTFQWNALPTVPGQTITSHRNPAGVRIWLDRPWWSSGEGELLGVVLWPGAEQDAVISATDPLKGLVTQWGGDPVVKSGATPSSLPRVSHFPSAVASDSVARLVLDEVSHHTTPPKVNVVGHQVAFDPGRKLWYCDIDVSSGGAYWPMIRLALARYQPESVGLAELSRVVLADFVQLAPDRQCSIVFSGDTTMNVQVTGTMHQGTTAPAQDGSAAGMARIRIEKHDAPDELGWTTVKTVDMLWSSQINGWVATNLTLPAPRGVDLFRLVVEQFDVFKAEKVTTKAAGFANTATTRDRLVYTDVIPL